MKQITVNISLAGDINIDAAGYEGSTCADATKWLEEALGETDSVQYKPEYYRQAGLSQQQRNKNAR